MSPNAVLPGAATAPLPTDEASAARLAWRIAGSVCLPPSSAFPGCASYHGIYPLLHALGMAATPDRHAEFYHRELGRLARSGDFSSVLVAGTADHGMLSHVLGAWGEARLCLEMLDLCPTPGRLCQEWAERHSLQIAVHAGDVLAWKSMRPYDLVVTHSFIPKFTPASRPQLFRALCGLLRPGGRLVTTVRIDPDEEAAAAVSFSDAQAAAFAAALVSRTAPYAAGLGIDLEQLHALALSHCAGMRSYPVASESVLRQLLVDGGFEIESLALIARHGRLDRRLAGSGTHRAAVYADFVAVRARRD